MSLKSYIYLIGGIVILFILWFVLIFSQNRTPKVISTTPSSGATNVSSMPSIIVVFDLPIDETKLYFSSTPAADWRLTDNNTTRIIIKPAKFLSYQTKYSLEIKYQEESLSTITFTTAGGQGDPQFYQQAQEVMERDYPLSAKFPKETDNYKVVYSAPLTIEIRLKNSTISQDVAISQVKSWISSNGGDAEKHKYIVVFYNP